MVWSDHGTNFVGANRELQLYASLLKLDWQSTIMGYCTTCEVQWKFTPEQAPHFGGLWEAAVKSFKHHMKRVVREAKLNFDELMTVTAQEKACLNSMPLIPLPQAAHHLEVLTLGHFLVGRPLEALPDHPSSGKNIRTL